MGRKPIGKRAMTPAERQARRRKRLRKERSVQEVLTPRMRPLATCTNQLEDDEVRALIHQLHAIARERKLELAEGGSM